MSEFDWKSQCQKGHDLPYDEALKLFSENARLTKELAEAREALAPFGSAELTSCSVLFSGKDKLKIQAVATFDTDYSQDVIDAFNVANAAKIAGDV